MQIPGGIPIISDLVHPIALLYHLSIEIRALTCCSAKSDAIITGKVFSLPINAYHKWLGSSSVPTPVVPL